MEFNDGQRAIRQAVKIAAIDLPALGSPVTAYDPAAVEIMKALDDAGFTVERKADA